MTTSEPGDASPPVEPACAPLDPTGVPGLDEVLGGGIQRGSLVIIAGPPGGGKTILAHHIAFSAARAGRRTTVLTAFSEPTNKLIAHMRPFAFFDQELIGQTLDVLSIQQLLRQGMEAAANDIVGAVRATQAALVVLDGFRGVRETAERPEVARQFIYDVSNRLSLLGITLVLTSEAHVRDAAFFPEATTADILLGLAFDTIDAHERRTLEVLKVRGAAPLSGLHAMSIDDGGITISPRLEARVARQAGVNRPLELASGSASMARSLRTETSSHRSDGNASAERVHSGVPGLDTLLDGGLVPSTSTLLVGARGAGKTLLGLQFALQGARAGEPSLVVSFRDTAAQLLRKAEPFQWHAELRGAMERGLLTVLRTPPIELRADVLADNLLAAIERLRARRLVVDEVGEIEHALATSGYALRFHDFEAALVEALRVRHVTTVFTRQAAADRRETLEHKLGPMATLTDNVVWLRHMSRGHRALAILQTALSDRSDAWHRVVIRAPEGLLVRTAPDVRLNDQREQHATAGSNRGAPARTARSRATSREEDGDDGD